jgi:hypothetical protein
MERAFVEKFSLETCLVSTKFVDAATNVKQWARNDRGNVDNVLSRCFNGRGRGPVHRSNFAKVDGGGEGTRKPN